MSTTPEKHMTRFYIIRTGKSHTILKVEGRHIESFLELLGDLIEASGDSREEVLEDFANRLLSKGSKWWEIWKK